MYVAVGWRLVVGSAVTELGVGGADRPRPSQKLGVIFQLCACTQCCAMVPHESNVNVQSPVFSACTDRFVGAAGPSGPVLKSVASEGVPCPWMYAVTVTL